MAGVGQLLREARETKGLTLVEVEQETRIRLNYLEALEAEEYDRLPGDVYVRGFLRNYARFLALEPEEVLAHYLGTEESLAASQKTENKLRMDVAMDVPLEPGRRRVILWTLMAIIVAAVLIGGGYWGYRFYIQSGRLDIQLPAFVRISATETATLTATATRIAPTPTKTERVPTVTATFLKATEIAQLPDATDTPTSLPSATHTPTQTPAPTATPTVTATPTAKVYRGVEIAIVIRERSWLQVTVDGVRVHEGVLEAGETRKWEGSRSIVLRAGNGGGVVVKLNGELLGPLGEPGEVVDVEWVKSGYFEIENPTGKGAVAGISNEQPTPDNLSSSSETSPTPETQAG